MGTQGQRRPPRRQIIGSIVRICLVSVVVFGVYAFAPLGKRPEGSALLGLVVSLLLLAAVVAWQIVAVTRSPYPRLRAVEAVTVSVPLLLVLFAAAYYITEQTVPGSFNESLTRVDAMYFSVTVFSTVGFGDIAAVSETARMQVTIQMIADLILIGMIARVLVGAARRRRQALDAGEDQPIERAGGPDK